MGAASGQRVQEEDVPDSHEHLTGSVFPEVRRAVRPVFAHRLRLFPRTVRFGGQDSRHDRQGPHRQTGHGSGPPQMERYLLNDEGRYAKQAELDRKIAAELISNADTVQRAESVEEPERIPLSRFLIPEEELRAASGSDIAPPIVPYPRMFPPGPYGAARRAQAIMPIDTKYPAPIIRVFSVCANRSRNRAADLRALPTTTIGYERESAYFRGPA